MTIGPPVLQTAVAFNTPHFFATNASRGSYIIALASTPTPIYAALATNSTDSAQGSSILLYSPSQNGLVHTHTLPISGGSTPSAMRVVDNFSGRPTLMSSHQQPGCIKIWDERTGAQPVSEIHPPKNRNILSFDVSPNGHTLAAGTDLHSDDASVFYWDARNPAQPLYTHSSTHSDDITALNFHPTSPHLLLSASTDGLLSTSDASEADEDEAVREVVNWGCSIARAGWSARDNGYSVWAASDMETFGLWSSDLDVLADFGDVRQPSLPGRWTTDYLIDACDFSRAPGPGGASGLTLFLGSNSGDVAFASVSDLSNTNPTWTLRGILKGGHSDVVVRSALWDHTNRVVVTGDEAGRLAAWRPLIEIFDDDVEMIGTESSKVGAGTKRGREDGPDEGIKRGRYES